MKLFLHMPKCGGTSVLQALEAASDVEIVRDYNSFFKIPLPVRAGVIKASLNNNTPHTSDAIIYGHFFPIKYCHGRPHPDANMVTIIRDPVRRLISHYNYWKSGSFPDHYLWNKMMENNWNFNDFAFCEEMQNIYSQYFYGIDVESFSYIGTFENLVGSFQSCCRTLGVDARHIVLDHCNKTMANEDIHMDKYTLQKLQAFHADDYAIYNYARRRFRHLDAA